MTAEELDLPLEICLLQQSLSLLLFSWTDDDHDNATKKDALIGALQW